jgi:predicted AAA+ superfamily ATPase
VIRRMQRADIDRVADIWLDTNIRAHNFISKQYWQNNFSIVKEMLSQSEIYVYEEKNEIQGFVGLSDKYIEGIFVSSKEQSKGIGNLLMCYVKNIKNQLSLSVYQKNIRAVNFYQKEDFNIQSENVDENTGEKDKLFDNYAINGGLAGSYAYRTEKDRTNYIKEVYETIVTRDLVQKYALPDTLVLQRLSEFLMDNISNLTSPNKVSQLLTANETPTNHVTVGKYIKYLCNAFVFYDIKRYDIRGKKYLESSEKFYLCDSGIRYAILGSRNMDYGRVYENIVCIELLRRGYDVYVGKLYQKEIDFVAQRGSEKFYIQVSDNISGHETFERECSPLLQIRDAYPKMIIARTKHPKYSYEGIEIHDIADWLLQE